MSLETNRIDAIFIPYDGPPSILVDTYFKIKSYVFESQSTYSVKITDDFYFILSFDDFSIIKKENVNASELYRVYTNTYQNSTVYGNALIVGTNYNSVPQSVIDSVLNIFYTK